MLRIVAIAAIAIAGLSAFVLLGIVLLVASGTAKLYAIPTSAMESTLHCARPAVGCEAGRKDRVVALTRFVSYGRGDLVVFDATERAARMCGSSGKFVKRIVGLPGERLELRVREGRVYVYVDGRRLEEPYVEDERRSPGPAATFDIPDDHYFVLGDFRAQSCDSSVWGTLPGDNLTGKLVATYWPPDRITIR
jgi:signal peptidase I